MKKITLPLTDLRKITSPIKLAEYVKNGNLPPHLIYLHFIGYHIARPKYGNIKPIRFRDFSAKKGVSNHFTVERTAENLFKAIPDTILHNMAVEWVGKLTGKQIDNIKPCSLEIGVKFTNVREFVYELYAITE